MLGRRVRRRQRQHIDSIEKMAARQVGRTKGSAVSSEAPGGGADGARKIVTILGLGRSYPETGRCLENPCVGGSIPPQATIHLSADVHKRPADDKIPKQIKRLGIFFVHTRPRLSMQSQPLVGATLGATAKFGSVAPKSCPQCL